MTPNHRVITCACDAHCQPHPGILGLGGVVSDVAVMIVEDDARYRASLGMLVTHTPGMRVAGLYIRAETMLEELDDTYVDLLLLDLDLPGMDGIETARRVRITHPDLTIVILTAFEDPPRILAAIQAGVDGYLSKQAAGDELVDYLHTAMAGGSALTPGVARSVMDLVRQGRQAPTTAPKLTTREQQVLMGLVEGDPYKTIAANHGMSLDTVRTHVRNLYRKLRVSSATEAVGKAFRTGLVE